MLFGLSDRLTDPANSSNFLAAVFSFPPMPGTHPNAVAAPCTIAPATVSHVRTRNPKTGRRTRSHMNFAATWTPLNAPCTISRNVLLCR
jgi:hypothetical protein